MHPGWSVEAVAIPLRVPSIVPAMTLFQDKQVHCEFPEQCSEELVDVESMKP